jgi:hypothetical protein
MGNMCVGLARLTTLRRKLRMAWETERFFRNGSYSPPVQNSSANAPAYRSQRKAPKKPGKKVAPRRYSNGKEISLKVQ